MASGLDDAGIQAANSSERTVRVVIKAESDGRLTDVFGPETGSLSCFPFFGWRMMGEGLTETLDAF